MIRVNLLESKMKELEVTYYDLAKDLNMSYSSLNKRVKGNVDFRSKEIAIISNRLLLNPEQINVIFIKENLTED